MSRARSTLSWGPEVVTVGASVDPYVRLTRHPNDSLVASTNAGLTEAPPVETSRRLRTLSRPKPADPAICEKNTGGAPMNDTCSSSIRRTASSGSHAAMSTVGIPAIAGMSTPLSSPDTCANGAGMSTASSLPSPCTATMSEAL